MLSGYRELFTEPGVWPFVIAGAMARLGISMYGIALVVMITNRRDSYAQAGVLTAVAMLAMALTGPLASRLVDRHGQARTAPPFAVVTLILTIALCVASWLNAGFWVLVLIAAASGIRLQPGTLTRSRWYAVLGKDTKKLHSANSLEQVIEEGCFAVGPAIAAWLATVWFPESGVLVAGVLFSAGLSMLAWQARGDTRLRGSDDVDTPLAPPVPTPPALATPEKPAWRAPGLLTLAILMACLGAVFGSIDVTVIGFAEDQGIEAYGGLLLGLFAFGSMFGGLAYGGLRLPGTYSGRLVVHLGLLMALAWPMVLITNPFAFGGMAMVTGLAVAPTLICTMMLAQQLSPPGGMNEAMAIVMTGMLIGASAGSAIAGFAIAEFGSQLALLLPLGFAATGLAVTAVSLSSLRAKELASDVVVLAQ